MGAFGRKLGILPVVSRAFAGRFMIKYIYKDMLSVMRFLPWALVIGIPASALVLWVQKKRRGEQKPVRIMPVAAFCIYFAVILLITLLSRESGGSKVIDLELFSSWGINSRNNAFVIENVLLFIPYGFVSSLAFRGMRNIFSCTAFGAATSVGVECLQLVTGRGFFQLDDILTNMIGAMLGCMVYLLFFWKKRKD